MKITRKRVIVVVLLLMTFLMGWWLRGVFSPPYPNSWNDVRPGMSIEEAHRIVPELDPIVSKGFDIASIDFGDSYWALWVFVDDDGSVSSVERRYVDRHCGLFSRTTVFD